MSSMDWVLKYGEKHRMKTAKQAVADYMNEDDPQNSYTVDDFYIVWFCKTLQNWKALIGSDVTVKGTYFEITYDGENDRIYLDHYQKVANRAIKMNPVLRDNV